MNASQAVFGLRVVSSERAERKRKHNVGSFRWRSLFVYSRFFEPVCLFIFKQSISESNTLLILAFLFVATQLFLVLIRTKQAKPRTNRKGRNSYRFVPWFYFLFFFFHFITHNSSSLTLTNKINFV